MVPKNIRFPDAVAQTGALFARAGGLSFTAFVCDAVREKVERHRSDPQFMARLQALLDEDRAAADVM